MKEHPILFSTEMVKAILEGRKTQTRRVISKPERYEHIRNCDFCCPYGQVGDRLWVRETWALLAGDEGLDYFVYKANPDDAKEMAEIMATDHQVKWHPSIFMPKDASRITLEITEIRVQKLQEISYEDIGKEGVNMIGPIPINTAYMLTGAKNEDELKRRLFPMEFADVWDSINYKKYPWKSNPWVWAITFKVVK